MGSKLTGRLDHGERAKRLYLAEQRAQATADFQHMLGRASGHLLQHHAPAVAKLRRLERQGMVFLLILLQVTAQ